MSIIFLLLFKSINKTCDISKLLIVLKTLPIQKLFQFGEKNGKTKYTTLARYYNEFWIVALKL